MDTDVGRSPASQGRAVSAPQFTPGPWGCATRQGSWDWVVFREADPNTEVCQMFHDGTDLNERGEANARLIAAAPEMFGALAHIRELLVAYGPRYIAKATKLADAALAKARGEVA